MSYIDDALTKGEQVLASGKVNKLIFISPSVIAVLGAIIVLSSAGLEDGWVLSCVGFPALIYGVIHFIIVLGRYLTTDLWLTNKRVIGRTGVINRHTADILYNKVESVLVSQGLVGRLFDFGTLVVGGSGGTKEKFFGIARANELKRQIIQHLDRE